MYSNLLFPLNIYAYILQLQEGEARYLHFGLFTHPDDSVLDAQQKSTDIILDQLPPPPLRILEVGSGLGTLYGKLRELGYEVTGINPDLVQVDIARHRLSDQTNIEPVKLEEFEAEYDYDLILLQESSQYIPVNALFSKCSQCLHKGGEILLLDEMRANEEISTGLHWLGEYKAVAEKFSFKLVLEKDFSQQAKPTIEYLITAINRHENAILRDLEVTQEQIDALRISLSDYQQNYANGDYIYRMLRFVL